MKRKAFTLAEVLITLGIIGVLAAILIPNIVENYREKQFTSQLKKVYAALANAYEKTLVEYGETYNWNLGTANSSDGANRLNELLLPNFRILNNCKTDGGCWRNTEIKYLNNTSSGLNISNNSAYSTAFVEGGMLLAFRVLDANCNLAIGTGDEYGHVCAEVVVDVNGEKNPNAYGYDVHIFYVTRHGFVPAGHFEDQTTTFANHCENGNMGTGCTAWVLQWSNMDYLHCSGLSWGGKNKCKNIFNYNYSL